MAFSIGSLAVISGFKPVDHSSFSRIFSLWGVRSIVITLSVLLVLLVLAYLTNPSETSFRAFLTEQAFRHHLSRLDDADAQDELESAELADKPQSLSRRGLSKTLNSLKQRALNGYASPPFAFASRASVSLRTPKHIFRSFGVLSIAAVVPSSRSHSNRRSDEAASRSNTEDGESNIPVSLISDSWFIGAFGMWFWAANLEGFWRDAGIISKDEIDGTITGVLETKALDRSDENTRVLTTNGNGTPTNHVRRSSPKLRSRDRFVNGNSVTSHRSQTPPPLPKSASLPLHTKRGNHLSITEKHSPSNGSFTPSANPSALVQPLSPSSESRCIISQTASASTSVPSSSPSRSPSALFASSPLIAEILRQLSASQNALSELRTQLTDFRSSSANARAALENELERQKEKKRSEDALKGELKAQTKALEDQKRTAEAARREAEKKLKNVRTERDRADARTARLEREMEDLHSQIEAQGASIVASGVEASALASELTEQVEAKKAEIRSVEEEIAHLGSRVREMEEKVATEGKRLEQAVEDAKVRKQNAINLRKQSLVQVKRHSRDELDTLISGFIGEEISPTPQTQARVERPVERLESFPVSPGTTLSLPGSPLTAAPSEAQIRHIPSPALSIPPPVGNGHSRGFTVFEKDVNSHLRNTPPSTNFSPFSSELTSPGPLSPTGESLIPSSLYESLGMSVSSDSPTSLSSNSGADISRSFQSEDDVILDRNWYTLRNRSAGDVGQPLGFPSPTNTGTNASPVSPAGSLEANESLEKAILYQERQRSLRMETQRATFSSHPTATDYNSSRISSSHPTVPSENNEVSVTTKQRTGWFTSHKDKETKKDKKGLNPDAKEFSLSKEKERSFSALLSRHRNYGGGGSGSGSNSNSSSTPSSASLSTPEPSSLISSPSSIHSNTVTVGTNSNSSHFTPQSTQHTATSRSMNSWFSLGFSRAFAPTPLEREQLARVLGGSTNTSLDRLDHLPSMPPSPQSQQPKPVMSGSVSGQGQVQQVQGNVLQNKFSSGSLSSSSSRPWDGPGLSLGLGPGLGSGSGVLGSNGIKSGSVRSSKSGFSPFDDDDSEKHNDRLEHHHQYQNSSGSSRRGSGIAAGHGVDELGFRT